jgi:hypothetical protein
MIMQHTTPHALVDTDDYSRMKTSILDTIDTRSRERTLRHRLVALGAVGVILLGTTAGAVAIAAAPQGQINYTADCYAASDMSAQHGTSGYLPGNMADATATPLAERISLATQQCAASWSVGTFAKAGTSAPFTVPSLVACQLPDQRLAIFPSNASVDATCSALGLATPHD